MKQTQEWLLSLCWEAAPRSKLLSRVFSKPKDCVAKPIQILHLSARRDRLGEKTAKNKRLWKVFWPRVHLKPSLGGERGLQRKPQKLPHRARVCWEGGKGQNWRFKFWSEFKFWIQFRFQIKRKSVLWGGQRVKLVIGRLKFKIGPGCWEPAWCATPAACNLKHRKNCKPALFNWAKQGVIGHCGQYYERQLGRGDIDMEYLPDSITSKKSLWKNTPQFSAEGPQSRSGGPVGPKTSSSTILYFFIFFSSCSKIPDMCQSLRLIVDEDCHRP